MSFDVNLPTADGTSEEGATWLPGVTKPRPFHFPLWAEMIGPPKPLCFQTVLSPVGRSEDVVLLE